MLSMHTPALTILSPCLLPSYPLSLSVINSLVCLLNLLPALTMEVGTVLILFPSACWTSRTIYRVAFDK